MVGKARLFRRGDLKPQHGRRAVGRGDRLFFGLSRVLDFDREGDGTRGVWHDRKFDLLLRIFFHFGDDRFARIPCGQAYNGDGGIVSEAEGAFERDLDFDRFVGGAKDDIVCDGAFDVRKFVFKIDSVAERWAESTVKISDGDHVLSSGLHLIAQHRIANFPRVSLFGDRFPRGVEYFEDGIHG